MYKEMQSTKIRTPRKILTTMCVKTCPKTCMLLHFNLKCRAQTNMQRLSIVCFSVCSLVNIHCCLFHLVCLVHKGCSNKMPHLARSRMAQHRDVGDKMFVFLKSRLYALREAHTHAHTLVLENYWKHKYLHLHVFFFHDVFYNKTFIREK